MPETSSETLNSLGTATDPEFFYTVLNLPKTAASAEVRERYRQLSVIFHPDKQHDERTKETATKRFLEIQKAYEVLSDPITRQAYDLFGLEGVKLAKTQNFSGLSIEEIESSLRLLKGQLDNERLQSIIHSSGRIAVGFDARSLFEYWDEDAPILDRLKNSLWGVRQTTFDVRHTLQKAISEQTTIILTGRSTRGRVDARDPEGSALGGDVLGTIRHQYSPKWSFEGTASLLRLRSFSTKAVYATEDTTVAVQSYFSPAFFQSLSRARSRGGIIIPIAPVSLTLSRRLFPGRNTLGTLSFSTNSSVPIVAFSVSSANAFDSTLEGRRSSGAKSERQQKEIRPPSRTGLAMGVSYWNIGATFAGLPGLNGELGINFAEIGVKLRTLMEMSFAGWSLTVGGTWSGEEGSSVSTDVGISADGIILRLDMWFLNQRFYLPILLSREYDETVALWTTLVPSTALVLAYHFVFKPRKRQERIEYLRQARRELREAKSDILRQADESVHLLRETARRHMETETSQDGLIILEATYGATDKDDDTEGLTVDVTIPVQALVHKSQLYMPGRRSKAALQGFYDPVPGLAKSLRIRYTFRGRPHYAEIPDFMPVVLPLEDHLAEPSENDGFALGKKN